jgi:16S rRNA processing protein RimM
MPENFLTIGKIAGVFGIKGEMKVRPSVDDEVYEELRLVYISGKPVIVENVRRHKEMWLLLTQGINNPEDAALLVGKTLSISRELLPPASDDEVYWADLEGALVVDEDGGKIGKLSGYVETGSHDVFEISAEDGKEYMISNNPVHVLKIDVAKGLVTVARIGLVEAN